MRATFLQQRYFPIIHMVVAARQANGAPGKYSFVPLLATCVAGNTEQQARASVVAFAVEAEDVERSHAVVEEEWAQSRLCCRSLILSCLRLWSE